MGLPILCEVVREERDELEMLRGALECLCLAVPAASGGNPQRPQVKKAPADPQLLQRRRSKLCG